MGFEKDVSQIISALDTTCSDERQTVLLSATLSTGDMKHNMTYIQEHLLLVPTLVSY